MCVKGTMIKHCESRDDKMGNYHDKIFPKSAVVTDKSLCFGKFSVDRGQNNVVAERGG